MASLIAGKNIGVAPKATLISVRITQADSVETASGRRASDSTIITALEYIINDLPERSKSFFTDRFILNLSMSKNVYVSPIKYWIDSKSKQPEMTEDEAREPEYVELDGIKRDLKLRQIRRCIECWTCGIDKGWAKGEGLHLTGDLCENSVGLVCGRGLK